MDFDLIAWWTGAIVLGGVGVAGAAALAAALYAASFALVAYYVARTINVAKEAAHVGAWVRAGKPTWHWDEYEVDRRGKKVATMRPDTPEEAAR